jgi:hypothetical protein
MIIFRHNIWRFASRGEGFRRVDGGVFKIDSENKTIRLSFYVSPILEIILFFIAAFFGITEDYRIFLFLGGFLVVMFIMRLLSVRATAEQMIDDILDT